jgi:hypothetical protein
VVFRRSQRQPKPKVKKRIKNKKEKSYGIIKLS